MGKSKRVVKPNHSFKNKKPRYNKKGGGFFGLFGGDDEKNDVNAGETPANAPAANAPAANAPTAPVDANKANKEECCPCNKNNIGDMLYPKNILEHTENKIVNAQNKVVNAVNGQVNEVKKTVQEKTGLLDAFFGNSKDNKPEVVDKPEVVNKPALGQAGGRKRKRRISKRRISRKGRKSQRRSKKSKRITRRRR